jgi:hypothetical protein
MMENDFFLSGQAEKKEKRIGIRMEETSVATNAGQKEMHIDGPIPSLVVASKL